VKVPRGTVVLHSASGTITAAQLDISATTDSKTYDGTTTSIATPTFHVANAPINTLYDGDTLTGLSQSFASRHVLGAGNSTRSPISRAPYRMESTYRLGPRNRWGGLVSGLPSALKRGNGVRSNSVHTMMLFRVALDPGWPFASGVRLFEAHPVCLVLDSPGGSPYRRGGGEPRCGATWRKMRDGLTLEVAR
jgi:hypothetical protein